MTDAERRRTKLEAIPLERCSRAAGESEYAYLLLDELDHWWEEHAV